MAVPRFSAQISQLQVPTMKNYQEQQNASIAQSLNDFGASLLSISSKILLKKTETEDALLELKTQGEKIASKDNS